MGPPVPCRHRITPLTGRIPRLPVVDGSRFGVSRPVDVPFLVPSVLGLPLVSCPLHVLSPPLRSPGISSEGRRVTQPDTRGLSCETFKDPSPFTPWVSEVRVPSPGSCVDQIAWVRGLEGRRSVQTTTDLKRQRDPKVRGGDVGPVRGIRHDGYREPT